MNGLDSFLVGVGLIGLLLTGVAVFGKRPASETVSIGAGSLGVIGVGLGGMTDQIWLMVVGVLLLVGAFAFEWYLKRHKSKEERMKSEE